MQTEELKSRFLKAQYEIEHAGKRQLRSVEEYLRRISDPEDYRFAKTILENTIYIPDVTLTSELGRITLEFLSHIDRRPFYLLLNKKKFASTELMIIKVMPLLIRSNLIGFVTDESILPPDSNVVIVDDASYSGNNLEAATDAITYHNQTATVHVLIPYLSRFVYEQLPLHYNIKFYSPNVFDYLDLPDRYDRFEAQEKLYFHAQLPLYFDHTVASRDSSFPTIYLRGIVPGGEDFGILIGYPPDLSVRSRVYHSYFEGILPTPI